MEIQQYWLPEINWLLLLDNSKSKNLLGWKPKFGVKEALEKNFEWYREYADGENMKKYSFLELQRFLNN
jgi:CDP-glucose 4,6-dehydratase